MSEEGQLPQGHGGLEVRRSHEGVHRATGPWTSTVHAFLRHLESSAFSGAPRVLGFDDEGREVLTFLDGEVLADPTWRPGRPTPWPAWARTDACLEATGQLLRAFHDAAARFVPAEDAQWRRHESSSLGVGEIVCHGDIGPHNTVYRDGLPVGFIDWDTIRPNEPLIEFGNAAWKFIPLGDDDYFAVSDFPDPPLLSRRVATFARAYGMHDRERVGWALRQAKLRSVEMLKFFPITPAQAAAGLRLIAGELEWLGDSLDDLLAELD